MNAKIDKIKKTNIIKCLENEIDESLIKLFGFCNRLSEGIDTSSLNMLEKDGVGRSLNNIWAEYEKIRINRQKIKKNL